MHSVVMAAALYYFIEHVMLGAAGLSAMRGRGPSLAMVPTGGPATDSSALPKFAPEVIWLRLDAPEALAVSLVMVSPWMATVMNLSACPRDVGKL
ncbi:hypothetical protein H4582DRAFT_1925819 [Lactarius indigo]|nr:hypothetical protein H4582DRAFT_1925819 [Lactarius indigo]